jgi:cytidylate kinase
MYKNQPKIIIAIDGYSSCGKSTLAKELARQLKYIYIDTGAMYRAVTLYCIQNDLFKQNVLKIAELEPLLEHVAVGFELDLQGKAHTLLNGINVEEQIRNMEVSSRVSEVSSHAIVRRKLVALQQKMGEQKGIILDGRDIGTVVFPEAEVKLFLTADPEVRAQRRYKELIENGQTVSFDEVYQNIVQRDFQDENRAESPLKKASDAHVLDNTYLEKHDQLNVALEIIKNTFKSISNPNK